MTERLRRVRVLQIPCAASMAWRQAIADACEKAGWSYGESWNGEPFPDTGFNHVVVGWSVENDDPEIECIVHGCSPAEAVSFLYKDSHLDDTAALYHASLRLAVAAVAAENGAAVADQGQTALVIPGLGTVLCPDIPEPATIAPVMDKALAHYRRLPAAVGVETQWSPALLSYPDPPLDGVPGQIGLLGRRRMLFNGPNIALHTGVWQIRVEFEVDPQDHADLFIEWGYGTEVVSLTQVIETDGRYEAIMACEWKGPAPADFRMSLMSPVLEGRLALLAMTVRRIG